MQNTHHMCTPHLSSDSMNFNFTENQKELNKETKRREGERRATFETNHYTQSLTKPLKHWLEAMCILAVQSQPHKKSVFIWVCAYSIVCVLKKGLKFWMCTCRTKAPVSCNSDKPRLQAQVTLLYWRFPAGNELHASRVWGKPQRHKECVLSGDLKPHIPPENTKVKQAPGWNTFMTSHCCSDLNGVSWETHFSSLFFFFLPEKDGRG